MRGEKGKRGEKTPPLSGEEIRETDYRKKGSPESCI